MIRLRCACCKVYLKTVETHRGKAVRCPKCGAAVLVPNDNDFAVSPVSPNSVYRSKDVGQPTEGTKAAVSQREITATGRKDEHKSRVALYVFAGFSASCLAIIVATFVVLKWG